MTVTLYTLAEVALNDGVKSPRVWCVFRDIVYDLTDYLNEHPGGGELITEYAGQDGTKAYDDFGHSNDANQMLKKYKIGELVEQDRKSNRNKKVNKSNKDGVEEIQQKKRGPCLFFCR